MKQRIILLITLTLAFALGWASPLDSLRIKPNTSDLTGKISGLESADGNVDPSAFSRIDGLTLIDFVTPRGTAATNSTSSEHKLWISYPSNAKVTFSDVLISASAIFIIKSEHVKRYTLTITGDDKDSFELDSYNINLGGLTNWDSRVIQQAVTIKFKPKRAGIHKAQVIIKEKGGTASCTLTVEGTAIPFIISSELNLNFDPKHKTRKFKVWGWNLMGPLYLLAGSGYSVSPTYIPASKAMALEGVEVTVTCNTTKVGETKLTIRSINAYDYVYLHYSSGSANAPEVNIELDETDGMDAPAEIDGNSVDRDSLEAWNNALTRLDELTQQVKIYAEGQNIIIESPVEQSAIVSDVAGHARSINLQAGCNEIPVNSGGLYIVRIREKATKLMIK